MTNAKGEILSRIRAALGSDAGPADAGSVGYAGSTAAPTATLPSSKASTSSSEPLCERPMGVRAPATMTASVMA